MKPAASIGGAFFAVPSHIAMTNTCHRHTLHIDTHAVRRKSFTQSFMVHFGRLGFSCNTHWCKGDHHAWSENASLRSAHGDSTNATGFVDILEGQMQGLVSAQIGGRMQSRALSCVVPLALPSIRATFHPFNQGTGALSSSMPSPFPPETGTNATVSGF